MESKPTELDGEEIPAGEPCLPDEDDPVLRPCVLSFIIKVWVDREHQGQWHGRVVSVPEKNPRYFNNLSEISRYIRPYLIRAGARVQPDWLDFLQRGVVRFKKSRNDPL